MLLTSRRGVRAGGSRLAAVPRPSVARPPVLQQQRRSLASLAGALALPAEAPPASVAPGRMHGRQSGATECPLAPTHLAPTHLAAAQVDGAAASDAVSTASTSSATQPPSSSTAASAAGVGGSEQPGVVSPRQEAQLSLEQYKEIYDRLITIFQACSHATQAWPEPGHGSGEGAGCCVDERADARAHACPPSHHAWLVL